MRVEIEQRHLPDKHDQSAHGSGRGSKVGRYATGSGTPGDPIKTNDVNLAARSLIEGKSVELDSPKQVSTLVDKLAKKVKAAEAKGKDAPEINLCGVSVSGTNLFCAENKGIARVEMPQLSGKPLPGTPADALPKNSKGEADLGPAFIEHLASKGVKTSDSTVDPENLKASQNELNGAKVAGMTGAMREGKIPDGAIFVTSDNYIVDGHHRWAAKVTIDIDNPQTMPVKRIDSDIITVLAAANDFTASQGIPSAASINKEGRNMTVREPECVGCNADEYDFDSDFKSNTPEVRSLPFEVGEITEGRSTGDTVTLSFEGYAAVFSEPTTITDWRGTYREQFAPTAFNRTLANRSQSGDQVKQIKFLFDHGQHPLIGAMPIGAIRSLTPDTRGLHVKARLPVNFITQPIIDGLRSKAIDGMSINFISTDESWSDPTTNGEERQRTIHDANLLELGPVLNPAYSGTEATLRSLSAHLRSVQPDLFTSTGSLPPAGTPAPTGRSTLDVYKDILRRR